MDNINRPQPFTFNGIEWYIADDVKAYDPAFFKGCAKTVRNILEIKKIADDQYLFASSLKNNAWKESNASNKKSKLLLKKIWVETYVPKMAEAGSSEAKYDVEPAPDLLYLDDEEKFKDEDGQPLEIEVRGERHHEKIYFKVSDVSKAFGMENLRDSILRSDRGYLRDIHYCTFVVRFLDNDVVIPNTSSDQTNRKVLYLTYLGMLRVLFASRVGKAERFQKWASDILFTHQMGTKEAKETLAADILGVPVQQFRESLSNSVTALPSIYFLTFNTVKELRTSMNIPESYPDTHIVGKYGFSKDLSRRANEHFTTFSKIPNVNIKMKHFSYVDNEYLSEAEKYIKVSLEGAGFSFDYKNYAELVIVPNDRMSFVKSVYDAAAKNFAHKVSDINQKMKQMQTEYDFNIKLAKQEYASEKAKSDALVRECALERKVLEQEFLKEKAELEAKAYKEKAELEAKAYKDKAELEAKLYEKELVIKNKDIEILQIQLQQYKVVQ
jgi:hypothetical protein